MTRYSPPNSRRLRSMQDFGSFSKRRTQTDQKLSWINPNQPCATLPVPPTLTG